MDGNRYVGGVDDDCSVADAGAAAVVGSKEVSSPAAGDMLSFCRDYDHNAIAIEYFDTFRKRFCLRRLLLEGCAM